MKTRFWITVLAVTTVVAIGASDFAFSRGGRGGGFSRGGGGGFTRGRSGGFSGGRPSGGFSNRGGSFGSSPSFSRPSVGTSRPSFNRPTTGASRPTTRPSLPATRPSTGIGSGSRPTTRPGTGIGSGSRPSTRPSTGIGSGTRPSTRPGTGIGSGSRPSTLPGLGTGGVSNRPGIINRPGIGGDGIDSRLPNQGANRPQTLEGRRANLSDRMASGREDWQNHREDMQGNRQDWRDNNREDWQNWADDNRYHHGGFYHGCWSGSWYPGAGWNYMWDRYPIATAFGLTAWGVNRMAYGFGYWGYSNPYASTTTVYNYSEPIVVYTDSGDASDSGSAPASNDAAMKLEQARAVFRSGNAAGALRLVDEAVEASPNDTVAHEFRGLLLFALKRYSESAATTYAVLSAGPGWDWTTMSGLYSSVEVYTQQLRALEQFARENPDSADAHFLLGYHYLTGSHPEAASAQFKLAQAQLPDDKLLAQLTGMTTPPDKQSTSSVSMPPAPADIPAEKVLSIEKLVGSWKASSQDAQFQLDLSKDGSFVWTYSRGADKQSMKGVYAVDQNNLALEPDSGGTMLAIVSFQDPSKFHFLMVGGDEKDPGLTFNKSE